MRVVKLGGSLLLMPNWAARFQQWLATQPLRRTLVVVGGGPVADGIRQLDGVRSLGEHRAHWLCIDAMGITAQVVAAWLELSEPQGLGQWRAGEEHLSVLDPVRFMRFEEPTAGGERLPASWDVTSDSIAARVATMLFARELVLLKSALPPVNEMPEDWAARGFVDRFFPQAARELEAIGVVNLRG